MLLPPGFGEILPNSRNSNTEHESSAALYDPAATVLKVMPEREACEFFVGACCWRMGSAKGLRQAGCPALWGRMSTDWPWPWPEAERGESGSSSLAMVEELTLNEIINQAAAASAGCLCAQIPAIGFRAWFPIPAERLAWGRGERAISVALHATDLTLCCKRRHFT